MTQSCKMTETNTNSIHRAGFVNIVGNPNVGKSTLFNKLIGQRLSIVEDTPGVTRDRIFAECEWRGRTFMLADTGGIEPKTDDVILAQMRDQAQLAIEQADVIVLVTDLGKDVSSVEENVIAYAKRTETPCILVLNKTDLTPELPVWAAEVTAMHPWEQIFHLSAQSGQVEELAQWLSGLAPKPQEVLITSDVGVETTVKIIKRIEERVARDKYVTTNELNAILKEEIASLLTENETTNVEGFSIPDDAKRPYVIMVVGVNGVGKTTTIGKLAHQFKKAGLKVYLGAADTFRAAAVEQLVEWGHRADVPVIKQKMGADPASVAFDTLKSAVANEADVVIIDTAGRLHNKVGLMNELTKIKNVMKKVVDYAPNEVLLVLDGSTGQNAFEQARQFTLATEVTALAITKLDGTAKGGVVIGVSDQFKIPVRYVGLGEGIDDLQPFNKSEFVDSLF